MEDFVEIDIEKIDALRNAYEETINSKSIYKMIGGNKMKSYKSHEIEKQKIDGIVDEYIDDVNQQYKNVESILFDIAVDGYDEGYYDGVNNAIRTYIRLSEYYKDALIGIFFGNTDIEDTNPIKSILRSMSLDTINTKLDAFDEACKENGKEVSTIPKAIKDDENEKIHTVKPVEQENDPEFKLTQEVREVADRLKTYTCEELLHIFGYVGIPEYRFSQYLMDYSVNQIKEKLDKYDESSLKAERAKTQDDIFYEFVNCITSGMTREQTEERLRKLINR